MTASANGLHPVAPPAKEAVLAALDRSGAQMHTTLAFFEDGRRPVPGLVWSVSDLAAHLVVTLQQLTLALRGEPCAYDGATEAGTSAAVDDRLVADFGEKEMSSLTRMFDSSLQRFADALKAVDGDHPLGAIAPHATAGAVGAIFVLDHQVHGSQLAAAGGPRWNLELDDICLGVKMLVPATLDRRAISKFKGNFSLHLRGTDSIHINIDRGSFDVDNAFAHVDCHIIADPLAFLRVNAGGFMTPFHAIITGKLFAYGFKPWKVLKLPSLMPPVQHGGKAHWTSKR